MKNVQCQLRKGDIIFSYCSFTSFFNLEWLISFKTGAISYRVCRGYLSNWCFSFIFFFFFLNFKWLILFFAGCIFLMYVNTFFKLLLMDMVLFNVSYILKSVFRLVRNRRAIDCKEYVFICFWKFYFVHRFFKILLFFIIVFWFAFTLSRGYRYFIQFKNFIYQNGEKGSLLNLSLTLSLFFAKKAKRKAWHSCIRKLWKENDASFRILLIKIKCSDL